MTKKLVYLLDLSHRDLGNTPFQMQDVADMARRSAGGDGNDLASAQLSRPIGQLLDGLDAGVDPVLAQLSGLVHVAAQPDELALIGYRFKRRAGRPGNQEPYRVRSDVQNRSGLRRH